MQPSPRFERLLPAVAAAGMLIATSTVTRIALAMKPKRSVERFVRNNGQFVIAPGGAPDVAREAIAFYQVASHLFRSGLYADEEQLPPEQRTARVDARR